MCILHVDKIQRNIGNGCTEPLLSLINTGTQTFYAVMKTKNNIQGILTVINEWIAYKLAESLGILMPESGIAQIDESTISEKYITEKDFGSCFYSKYIEKAGILNQCIMDFIVNKDSYEKIILFDHLVYNKDRNRGNLLVTTGKGDKILYAIDHSHIFKNETIWDRFCFQQGIQDKDYMDNDIMLSNRYDLFFHDKEINEDTLKREAEKFSSIINSVLLDGIINSIPIDWEISDKNTSALKQYILYRSYHLEKMCDIIIDFKKRR